MKISIITVTYNREETLRETIESVLSQDYAPVEYIIIDGASTDDSLTIINEYAEKISKIVSEPDKGAYDALNKGIQMASGDIIGFLHSDDIFADRHILSSVAERFANHDIDVLYGDIKIMKKKNSHKVLRSWKSKEFKPQNLKSGWSPPHTSLFMRKEVYEKVGGFDTHLKIAADYEFILRVFKNLSPKKVSYLSLPLVLMKSGGLSNNGFSTVLTRWKEDYYAVRKNGVGGVKTVLMKKFSKLPQFFRV